MTQAAQEMQVELTDAPAGTAGLDQALVWTERRREFLMRRVLALLDGCAVFGALVVTAVLGAREPEGMVVWGFLVLPVWTLLFKLYGLYERDQKRMSHSTVDDLPWVFHAVLVGSIFMWAYYKLLPRLEVTFDDVVTFSALVLVFVLAGRVVLRQASNLLLPSDRVLFVGASPMTAVLARKIESHPEYGLQCIGYLGDEDDRDAGSLERIGSVDQLAISVEAHSVDRAIVAADALPRDRLLDLAREAKEIGLKLSILPDMHDVLGPSVEIDSLEGVTVLGLNPAVLSRSSRMLKRAIDVTLAGLALVLAAPMMALIAVAIRLDSPGPIIFRQRRIGLGGEVFELLKFRTMVANAEDLRTSLLADSKDAGWLHLERDPRITRIGRFLRQYSLDELPQLWNVVRGDMSLVGPRPLIEVEDRNVAGWGRRRLDLTPGVTGLWQVLGRTNIPFEEMVKLDYLYVTNWSLWGDIRIIAQTLPVVLRQRGSN